MALGNQDKNFISELMNWSQNALALRSQAQLLRARYYLNRIGERLNDTDVQQVFSHLTAAEVAAGVTAMEAVLTALGDDVSGQATALIKMQG